MPEVETPSAAAPRSRTARERVRRELTAEILAVARRHLGREGAAALSLRSVARELGMAPSALYRYFDSRDALLSALILDAFESLAAEAEAAAGVAGAGGADGETSGPGDAVGAVERWLAVPRAVRAWALAHPHEWGLVFGTPVPGYEAPQSTVAPYARVAAAMSRPVVEAFAAGRLRPAGSLGPRPDAAAASVAPVAAALLPGVPAGNVVAAVGAWSTVVGMVSLEVFGHWRNTVLDPEVFFDATMRDLARRVGLG
ncbi:MAG TPA: TetR/AcrR family transcriptional regulator [Acidimicrobiales bacterium]|nr:TetR/AcrR family transcriptional regulator [Acidimicrobiales bacterium]